MLLSPLMARLRRYRDNRMVAVRAMIWLALVLGGLALPARAQLSYPQLTAISRESGAVLTPGSPLAFRFTAQPGTAQIASLTLTFFNAGNTIVRSLRTTTPATGVISGTIGDIWANGDYRVVNVMLIDTWGRAVTYLAEGSDGSPRVSPSSSTFYAGPTEHALDFGSLSFRVTGAARLEATESQIKSIGINSSATVSAGETARFSYELIPGATPMSHLALSFRVGVLLHTVLFEISGTSGEVSLPITSAMLNGRYTLNYVALTGPEWPGGVSVQYQPNGGVILTGDGVVRPVVLDSPYFALTPFTVTGAGTTATATAPQLTTWTRDGGAEVGAGTTLHFNYATAATAYPVRTVAFRLTGPFGGVRDFTSTAASGTFTVPVEADWIEGAYTVARVVVTDIVGRATTYAPGGSISVSTGVAPPATPHGFAEAAFAFTAKGLPARPYFTLQPASDTPAKLNDIVTLSARGVGVGGAAAVLAWFRGAPGDTSTPVTTGISANGEQLTITVTGATATYWVRVTSGGFSTSSAAATVRIVAPPTLIEHPAPQVTPIGGTATFSVTAAGDGPYTYEWLIGQGRQTSALQRTFQVKVNSEYDAGFITCKVTGPGGTVTSRPAMLTVLGMENALRFISEPDDQYFIPGTSLVYFEAQLTGNVPMTYRWQKDGVDLGAPVVGSSSSGYFGSAPLRLDNPRAEDAGVYRVIVTNGFETIYSRDIRVVRATAPIIRTQLPAAVTKIVGDSISLGVGVVGQAPFTYQWRKDGVPLTGVTGATFFLPARVTLADSGNYDVIVTNAVGVATSTPTTLTVKPAATAPTIAVPPASRSARPGETVTFTVVPSIANQRCTWLRGAQVLQDGFDPTFTLRNVGVSDANGYAVRVGDPDVATVSSSFGLTVTPTQDAPRITRAPVGGTFKHGETARLNVAVDGQPPFVVIWRRNGVNVGSLKDYYSYKSEEFYFSIPLFDSAKVDSYSVEIRNSYGYVTSPAVALSLPPPSEAGRLMNLSVRANAGGAYGPLIVGFVTGGGQPESIPLLFRAAGKALEPFGVTGTLANPVLTLYRGTGPRFSNDDWSGFAPIATAASRVGAFPFPVAASRDAAFLLPLAPQNYTVYVTSADATGGVALAEIYDASPADEIAPTWPRLLNLSVQTKVDGVTPVIVGFALGGAQPKKILVRAIGPGLSGFGVQGVLPDPRLTLRKGQTTLAENNDWGGTTDLRAAFDSVGAFALSPATSKDSALVATLTPGAYTVQVDGVGGASGVVLVEIYELP